MIHDVDEALKAMIRAEVVAGAGAGVEISFEAPSREWAAKRTVPTIDCYLYDIREDTSRRDVFYEDVRDDDGMVVERRQPPRRFKLSYLLTVWTQRTEDEHRLLSALLKAFLRADRLPPEVLVGSLAESGRPVITTVALPPAADRSIGDVWSALGGELKPSLDLAVVAPFDVGRAQPAGPPVVEGPRISVAPTVAPAAGASERGGGRRAGKGRRTRAERADDASAERAEGDASGSAPRRAPSAVEVELEELGVPTHSPEGKPLTLPARLVMARRVREATRRSESDARSAQHESARSGTEDQPGRVFRIRGLPRP